MKLITKILDKYYSDKLCKEVKTYMLQWFIDVRIVERKYTIELQVKNPKYDEKQYKKILTFGKDQCFYYMCIFGKVKNAIKDAMERYSELTKEVMSNEK